MSTTRSYDFETPTPVDLYVEIGSGHVGVEATDTTRTRIRIDGAHADDVVVEQSEDRISVVAPHRRGFGGSDLDVVVELPTASALATRTGSAGVDARGTLGGAHLRSGSGELSLEILEGPALVETGSGGLAVTEAHAELRIKSGSGDVRVERTAGGLVVSTGSGDVSVGEARGATAVKTGSGGLRVGAAHDDVSLTTGSGDLEIGTAHRGRLSVKGASGGVRVGIPHGVPVWTDISTVSGEIASSLDSTGEPAEGQDHVELRATTVSGSVVLVHV